MISQNSAHFLHQNHASKSIDKSKASHARELVAAFFGYKSHAALMSEKIYPLEKLEEAYTFIPDIPLMNERRAKLSGLPNDISPSIEIAKLLSNMITSEGLWLRRLLEWRHVVEAAYTAPLVVGDLRTGHVVLR